MSLDFADSDMASMRNFYLWSCSVLRILFSELWRFEVRYKFSDVSEGSATFVFADSLSGRYSIVE
jgi:hypothetical protein